MTAGAGLAIDPPRTIPDNAFFTGRPPRGARIPYGGARPTADPTDHPTGWTASPQWDRAGPEAAEGRALRPARG